MHSRRAAGKKLFCFVEKNFWGYSAVFANESNTTIKPM